MIYRITGTLLLKRSSLAVIECGGVAFKLFVSHATAARLPDAGQTLSLFSYLHVREDALELYGFSDEREQELFERLNNVSGIGPKSALAILSIAPVAQVIAAINEGRPELLTRTSGIGRKTADRIVLELKGKLSATLAPQTLQLMESDAELEETLVSLGFQKAKAKSLIAELDPKLANFKDRLKATLKAGKRTP